MIRGVIFDFNRTLFNPETKLLTEGIDDLLLELVKDYALGLVSTGGAERQKQIKKWKLHGLFSCIYVASEKKESHFQNFCNSLRISSNEVLVVGDRVRSEIKIGNILGMKTVWFRQGLFSLQQPRNKHEEPMYVIESLGDLPWVLSEMNGFTA